MCRIGLIVTGGVSASKAWKCRIVAEGYSDRSTAAWFYHACTKSYTRPCRPSSVSWRLESIMCHWRYIASSRQSSAGRSEKWPGPSTDLSIGTRRLNGVKDAFRKWRAPDSRNIRATNLCRKPSRSFQNIGIRPQKSSQTGISNRSKQTSD